MAQSSPLALGLVSRRASSYNSSVIDAALKLIVDEVNAHLLRRSGSSFGPVELGPLVDDKGSWLVAQDTLRLALFLVDEERTLREQMPERVVVGSRELTLPPPLKLNLVVVFAARFQQYAQALRHLSLVLTFLQARPVFTPSDFPAMPEGIDRLSAELLSYTPEQANQMWACIGAKQLPSVVYRLRMLLLQDTEPLDAGAPITTIDAELHGR